MTAAPATGATQILRIYWDDEAQPVGRVPARRLLRAAAGASTRRSARCRSASTRAAPSTATGRCRSASARGSRSRTATTTRRLALLPDQLHADRRARRRGLLPRAVPAHQPAALQGRSTRSSTACTGEGHYVGTYMAWGVNNTGWWGEGEIKFFIDGDGEFPTICGTGTEDYFCGAYNFDVARRRSSTSEFTTPYAGLPQVIRPDGALPLAAALRHVPLAHHRPDPLRARTCASRSRRSAGAAGGRYLPLQDDIASVAFWYQTPPTGNVSGVARQERSRRSLEPEVTTPLRTRRRYAMGVTPAWRLNTRPK